jgi:small subunit ribosomal protein S15
MITKERKHEIVGKIGASPRDTGGTSAQIALITERINDLQDHFARNPKDHMSRRGLLTLVGHRRRLLSFLRRENPKRYVELLSELNLRK